MKHLTIIFAFCISIMPFTSYATLELNNKAHSDHLTEVSDMACLYDITISQWDCMLAVAGSIPCSYKDYDILFSSSASGPFTVIGTHDISSFYFVPNDGYYKLKVSCGGVCHESNVLHYDNNCSPACDLKIDAPFPEGSTINHCYADDKLQLNASTWYTGCSVVTYKWVTPSGIVSGATLDGNYGYGSYLLTITCHDADCYYETVSIWFKVKEHCYTTPSYCHFDIDLPYHSKDHCYEDDGDLWINGASWVDHCSDATYKWVTPIGNVHGPILEGNFGYGTYTLKVICNSHDCHYLKKEVSFVLKKKCVEHCHFKLDSPLDHHIKHCYEKDGIVWIDASPWVHGCHNVHYKWETPRGTVSGAVLDGNYGYGKFTLKVVCHDAACYYETLSTSFILVDDCHKPYVIHCPGDKWVECDAELWDLDDHGKPYYHHHGKKVWVYGDKVHRHMNDCNQGYITREWKVKDPHGFWHNCSQTIYVGRDIDGKAKIDWPKEFVEVEGCNPSIKPEDMPYGAKKPYYHNSGCSKLGHSYSDQEFYYSGTCKKVVRKWTVIDWCVYDGNKDRDKGKYIYYQTIKINNDDKPVVMLEDKIKVSTKNCENVQVDLDDIEIHASSCGDYFKITNDSPYADKSKENASGVYPIGTTKFYYEVAYGCGYSKKYKQEITVEDEGDLNIYCEGKLVMPLAGKDTDGDGVNDEGAAEIWAKDFNIGSKDLCGGDIVFSFEADSLVMARTFTCAEVGINEINIYASDSRGNQTYCVVEIHIQNNGANIKDCEPDEEETQDEEVEDTGDAEEESEDDNNEEETDGDETEEDSTHDEEEGDEESNDDDSTEEETDVTSNEDIAKASGLIKTQYGQPVADVRIDLYMNVSESSGESTFEIVDTKVDSFIGGSGALIYILAKDTVWYDAETTESMVMQSSTDTDVNGEFLFSDMARNETYMIEPTPDMMDGSKLDISDANRLYAHLSGADPITDPYALIAADVDQSGAVDLDDLDYLLAFVNGENDELADIQIIYIDATYQFDDELDPWSEPYSTHRMIEASEVENHRADFIAVTLGDIVDSSDDVEEDEDLLLQTDMRTRRSDQAIVSPNPFYRSTTITVDNPKTQMAVLTLYTIDGQRVHESELRLAEGLESFKISDEMTPHTGVYIYTLALEEKTLRGRLLKIK